MASAMKLEACDYPHAAFQRWEKFSIFKFINSCWVNPIYYTWVK